MKQRAGQRETAAQRALVYREAWLSVITPQDVRAITRALLERAKAGDILAARLVLDRLLGVTPVGEWESRLVVEERTRLDEILGIA